jgi:blue light- and temperature-responsive anti-repressor
MAQLYRVLYCSRNRIAGDADRIGRDITSILAASRENNARDDVTGGLLFSEGCFAQVLEGPLGAIESAFERIQCDNRHSDVIVLQSGPIDTRDFPDWSMAFAGIRPADNPLVSMALADAFSGRSRAGDAMFDVLKGVVARETDWLAATP